MDDLKADGTVPDYIGGDNNGTLMNHATNTTGTGYHGEAILFDGDDDYVLATLGGNILVLLCVTHLVLLNTFSPTEVLKVSGIAK